MSGGLKLNGINSKGTELLITEIRGMREVIAEIKEVLAEQKALLTEIKEVLQGN